MKRFPLFVFLPLVALAIYAGIGGPRGVMAQQPRLDSIDVDIVGCAGGSILWNDGLQTATKIVVTVNANASTTFNLTDIVGDQSRTFAFVAAPGDNVIIDLYVDNERVQRVERTIPACPTATATSTPTSTATAVPATATPAPTSTPAPIPTPIVITNTVIQERVVTVPAATSSTSSVRPPSTGSGGLKAWDWGGWGGADSWLPCYYGYC